jgi:hypothetical protein
MTLEIRKQKYMNALNELKFIENKLQAIRVEINKQFNDPFGIDPRYINEKIEKISDSMVILRSDLGIEIN